MHAGLWWELTFFHADLNKTLQLVRKLRQSGEVTWLQVPLWFEVMSRSLFGFQIPHCEVCGKASN